MKPEAERDEQLIAACESTLAFQQEDYQRVKMDWVVEVHDVLCEFEREVAHKVLDGVREMWPQLDERWVLSWEEWERLFGWVEGK